MHIFFEVGFDTVNFFFFHDPGVHPEFQLIIIFADFDSDAVHCVDVLVFRADHTKDAVFPEFVCFLLLDAHLEEASSTVAFVLPLGLEALLEDVHIAV